MKLVALLLYIVIAIGVLGGGILSQLTTILHDEVPGIPALGYLLSVYVMIAIGILVRLLGIARFEAGQP